MVAEQRCPECGAPVAAGAPYCPNGHALAWREEPEEATTDLGGADRGRYDDEALVTRRMATDEPPPRDPSARGASAGPPPGPVGAAGVGVGGGGLQRVRRGPNPAAIVLGVLLLGVLAAAGWYFVNARGDGAVPAGATAASETATASALPSASAAPSATAEPAGETYEIQAGDSLSAIAAQFDTTVEALAAENEIVDINAITVGQVLVIPPETGTASP